MDSAKREHNKQVEMSIQGAKNIIISGPCSAESEEQVLATAHLLKKQKIDIFRAGIWKPRTRAKNFEGVGEIGLKWLQNAAKETAIPCATEVATAKHVELALKHDIKILWIGARTSVSPFAVQEIADALRGSEAKVMVKNPMNPDLELWIGAIERIQLAGISDVIAIHRGFSTGLKSIYRNEPKWDIPLELKARFPEIKLICDPSHIAGTRNLLKEICDQAIQLHYNGLMIEAHIDPDSALSDAKQQIKPADLAQLIQPNEKKMSTFAKERFDELRKEINHLDSALLETLYKRMEVSEELGEFKRENHISVFQYERFVELMKSRMEKGKIIGLNEQFVKELYHLIHNESVHQQHELFKK